MKQPTYNFYQVARVFLACPGDLMAERSRFMRVLNTVNNLRAHSLGFHLEPAGWERVIPSLGRPQSLINEELTYADLVVVMFWNRIGSPSDSSAKRTGTIEEFDIAMQSHTEHAKPSVWVYFKKPSVEPDAQLEQVLAFRKKLEEGKQLFFREFETSDEWEEMFREHLVAYLDGLERSDFDRNFRYVRPEIALVKGDFLANGVYRFGTRMEFPVDLDGDGINESVHFWFSQFSYKLRISKYDKTVYLPIPFDPEEHARKHVAQVVVKDVTNDGLPEIIVAFGDGAIDLYLYVYGFAAGTERVLSATSFIQIGSITGQHHAYIYEGGLILVPYGSQNLAMTYRWNGAEFVQTDAQ